jgi:enoyl-CoA hydratase/carnithine racemase
MPISYEKEDRIAIFTINRPQAGNTINMEVIRELTRAMIDFRDDSKLLVGIITGAGEKAFSAGADLKDTLPFMKEHHDIRGAFPPTIMRGLEVWKPIIAAINGLALGGGLELALACDLRIAAESARFGTPEVGLGLIPGWGGTQRLPRMLPWCQAAELLLMGTIIDAQEAYRIGLINKVVPQSEVMPAARQWAATICQRAPLAVQAAKEAMVRGSNMSLEAGLLLENSLENYCFSTEDYTEGINAFLEKRKPDYKGK